MTEEYAQIFNKELDYLYVNLSTGIVSWTLPFPKHQKSLMKQVIYISHLSESKNKYYYENLQDKSVAWILPSNSFQVAKTNTLAIEKMSRKQTEDFLNVPYNDKQSSDQLEIFEHYLECIANNIEIEDIPLEDEVEEDVEDEEGELSSDDDDKESTSPDILKFIDFSGKTNVTQENIKDFFIKKGHLVKQAVVSQRNWKQRYFVLMPYSLNYYSSSTSRAIKGEFPITPNSRVESAGLVRPHGYTFKFSVINPTNGKVSRSVSLAAHTEEACLSWVKCIEASIQKSKSFITGSIIRKSTSLLMSSKQKFFVLCDHVLTCHADELHLASIEGVMTITPSTQLMIGKGDNRFSIVNAGGKMNTTVFDLSFADNREFSRWKDALNSLISYDKPIIMASESKDHEVSKSRDAEADGDTAESTVVKPETAASATIKPFHEDDDFDFSKINSVSKEPTKSPPKAAVPILPAPTATPSSTSIDSSVAKEVFQKYAHPLLKSIDFKTLQSLCYNYGAYLTIDDIKKNLDDEEMDFFDLAEFIKFWNGNQILRYSFQNL